MFNKFNFKDHYPDMLDDVNTDAVENTNPEEKSELLDDVAQNILLYISTYNGTDDITVPELVDKYFETTRGKFDKDIINDIALKFGTTYHQNRDVLVNTVSEEVSKLTDQVNALFKARMDAYNGYTSTDGAYTDHIKFDYIDIDKLEDKYKATVEDIAKVLCGKFNFNVDVLSIKNIKPLIKAVETTTNINMSSDTKNHLLKEVVITIRTDDETEANSEITVNGESAIDDPDTTVNTDDTSATDTTEVTDTTTDENTEVDATVNDDTGNSNININVNGKPVTENTVTEVEDEEDKAIEKDKELLYNLIASSLYSKDSFNKLKSVFTTSGGYNYTSKQLQHALWFAKIDINNVVNKITDTKLQYSERYAVINNAKCVLDLQKCIVVYLDLMLREFKDTILITPRLINKAAYQNAQNRGIDVMTMMKDYLRIYHNKNKLDCIYNKCEHSDLVMGVDLDRLLTTRDNVQNKIKSYTESIQGNNKEVYKHNLKHAFEVVMNNYITDIITTNNTAIPAGMSKDVFKSSAVDNISRLSEQMINNDTSNIEDYVYMFYFMYWQKNTLVERIYNEMSYHLQSDIQSMHGEDTQKLVHAKVMSSIIVDMLKKHM